MMKSKNKKSAGFKKKPDYLPKHVSYTHKPADMTDKDWQTALRRQLGEKEYFDIENTGTERVYSDYRVFSPNSKNTYKVALRSQDNTLNFCSCPDFKTNLLGTCKHIEAVRYLISKKRVIRNLLHIIPEIPYSSLYVSYYEDRAIKSLTPHFITPSKAKMIKKRSKHLFAAFFCYTFKQPN
jgi:hypothetical protein